MKAQARCERRKILSLNQWLLSNHQYVNWKSQERNNRVVFTDIYLAVYLYEQLSTLESNWIEKHSTESSSSFREKLNGHVCARYISFFSYHEYNSGAHQIKQAKSEHENQSSSTMRQYHFYFIIFPSLLQFKNAATQSSGYEWVNDQTDNIFFPAATAAAASILWIHSKWAQKIIYYPLINYYYYPTLASLRIFA